MNLQIKINYPTAQIGDKIMFKVNRSCFLGVGLIVSVDQDTECYHVYIAGDHFVVKEKDILRNYTKETVFNPNNLTK